LTDERAIILRKGSCQNEKKMRHSLIVLGAFSRESKEGSYINFFDFPNQFID